MPWLTPTSDGCTVTVKATPRANRSEITGADPDWLRVRLQAPPVDGKANTELAALFASIFSIPKRAVELLSGDTARLKRIKLHGVPAETAAAVVARLTHDA
ncbi:MAG: DUF167 domain-containing protein [Kiritimatiellia bacterium]|jgi:uncharacterized protein (TIGR00251 family)|nr:DUF167 domain-containing protein [Kiritimatiellia bacterium]MDD4173463.1 DUF167 domain-containing protein [Kiritimatiellia bacterium]MDD4441508.1 DUF167 domain-containing protein [Kiritimatiellia bacterium]MDX9793038.1 DUF167 domain-containing protein [Kiritimatiellia bacterium]NLC79928.1 DUF167 domain-containing protein [Lentisphaerota bacterium]